MPTGCTIFPEAIIRPPRRGAEARFEVRRWSLMASGGHFASPGVPVADVRSLLRELR